MIKTIFDIFRPINLTLSLVEPPVESATLSIKEIFLNIRSSIGRMLTHDEVDQNFKSLEIKTFKKSQDFDANIISNICDISMLPPLLNEYSVLNFEMVEITYGIDGIANNTISPLLNNFAIILDGNLNVSSTNIVSTEGSFSFTFNGVDAITMSHTWAPVSGTTVNKMFKITPKEYEVTIL